VISSRQNEKLKLVRKLADRRWRDKLGLFVVEGEDLVGAGRTAAIEPVELLVARRRAVVEARLGRRARARDDLAQLLEHGVRAFRYRDRAFVREITRARRGAG